MRALVLRDTIEFDPHYPPPQPAEDECLVRVRMAGVCSTDLQLARGYMNFRGVPGHEFVGTVEQGPPAWVGKRVVAEINCVCRKCDMCVSGLSNHCRKRTVIGIVGRDGAFADLLAVPVRNLHEIPDSVSDQQAVFVEPLAAAYQVLAQVRIEPRMSVTVVGPGRLGLLVLQVLKATGCRLTAVGRGSAKLLMCEKLGVQGIPADEVAAKHDRDVVIDCSGSPAGLELAMGLVRPRGTLVLKSTYADAGALNLAPLVIKEVSLIGSRCGPFAEAIGALARRAVDVDAMVSKTFPLERAAEALEAAADPKYVKVMLAVGAK
jgi:alcohol dehydrogenase